MNKKTISIIFTFLLVLFLVSGEQRISLKRTLAAQRRIGTALAQETFTDLVRIAPDDLDALSRNCITRDYLILILNRVLDLRKDAGDEPRRSVRAILEGVPRCQHRGAPLDTVRPGRWMLMSGAIRIDDPQLFKELLATKNFWEPDPPSLPSDFQAKLEPLRQGPPTRGKLQQLEQLYTEYPGHGNIIQNLLRGYMALRDLDGFNRLMNDPKARELVKNNAEDPFFKPFYEFIPLAALDNSYKSTYKRAAFYFLNGDLDNTIALCDEGIKARPGGAAFYFLRALALHGLGRQQDSESAIKRALELDLRNPAFQEARRIIDDTFVKTKPRHPVVLCYHRVSGEYSMEPGLITPETLEMQISYVESEKFADAQVCGPAERKPPPRTPAVGFTFDDGYHDTGDIAWPMLQRHHRSAAMFVIAGRIFNHPSSMNVDRIKELLGQGLYIGLHTLYHPKLTAKTDADTLDLETRIAHRLLQRAINAPVTCFAYSYGAYTPAAEKLLRTGGITETYALDNVPPGKEPTRRIPIVKADSFFLFKIKLYDLDYDRWINTIRNMKP